VSLAPAGRRVTDQLMPRGLVLRLLGAFSLAVACFVGSTLYSAHLSATIDDRARAIAAEILPSIERLAETRGRLRSLLAAVARYQQARGEATRGAVVRARAAVEEEFEQHLSLPPSHAGEQARWADIDHALRVVERATENALAAPGAAAADEVLRAIDVAAEEIRTTIELDVDHARALALEIEAARRWATRVAMMLDLTSAVFTALAALLALRAVAERQRLIEERTALVARRAEELEQFAGRVAHDILGPLSVTRLSIEGTAANVGEPAARSLARAQRGVDRVTSIVEGLLGFARAGAHPEPGEVTSVAAVARGVVGELETLARDADVTLTLGPLSTRLVLGHSGVIASVVSNLVTNAIKYMGDRLERRVEVRALDRGPMVRIEVEDSGPGVPPEIRDTLFDPHVRGRGTGKPGIGLGLATVRRIAEAHGGACGVHPAPSGGSTFWIELPCADDAIELTPLPISIDRGA
jgi:signal transduction histidine kinase